jgi:hypothetical protein
MPDLRSFDPDEVFLLFVSGILSLAGFVHWFRRLRPVSTLGAAPFHRAPLYLSALAGFAALGIVILLWADPDIRDNSGYVLLVFLMGGAWLTAAAAFFPWLGTGLRDDALERRNPAATLALSGAIFAVMLTFSGANIGAGPSFWNNVFSGLLSTGTLLFFWLILAAAGGAAQSVSEERDVASGLRLGSFLLSEGLILGRAVAGDWHSVEGTVRDFVQLGQPGVVLLVVAVVTERALRPKPESAHPPAFGRGAVPAVLYLAVALSWTIALGWWEGGGR